jgi:glycosyltransferase involved in cell wall biosynthesis
MNLKRSINKRINRFFGSKQKALSGPIINFYNTNYDRSVLVSYIVAPFLIENHFMHQNFITSHIIAESFSELGYNVDIVNYDDTWSIIDFEKYSVFFGFGQSLEKSFHGPHRAIPRISFITGVHQDLQNEMTLKSVTDFYSLSGQWLPQEADVLSFNAYYSMYNADITIILADGFVLEDCRSRNANRLHSLNNNIIGSFTALEPKTEKKRNSNFLFLSGAMLLKKGLSILLEVARMRRDLNFYIIVPYVSPLLKKYYEKDLYESPNIFLSTNLKMNSIEMQEIVQNCSYCLAPSYADGFPGGTIEPMSAGLIPIVSKYCGFPSEEFIFELDDLSAYALNEAIDRVLSMDDVSYLECSKTVKAYAVENYSVSKVKDSLLKILKAELS